MGGVSTDRDLGDVEAGAAQFGETLARWSGPRVSTVNSTPVSRTASGTPSRS